MRHTWALLRWWFTTKRRYIKCMHLYLYLTSSCKYFLLILTCKSDSVLTHTSHEVAAERVDACRWTYWATLKNHFSVKIGLKLHSPCHRRATDSTSSSPVWAYVVVMLLSRLSLSKRCMKMQILFINLFSKISTCLWTRADSWKRVTTSNYYVCRTSKRRNCA